MSEPATPLPWSRKQWAGVPVLEGPNGEAVASYMNERDCDYAMVACNGWAELQKPCVWTYDEYHDKWDTACGEAFQVTDDTPSENGMKFCCYCQKPIQEQREEIDE